MENNNLFIEAKIKIEEETPLLREKASKAISLPKAEDRQPDLLYFSAILVSTGTNLNNAHFLGSELVMAENTLSHKAMDIEHKEADIVGHIYERKFIDIDGNAISLQDLNKLEKANLDSADFHIAIAGVVYKSRFPEFAQEVEDNNWKVSMECFYKSFDIKVGDLILSLSDAEVMGLNVNDASVYGKVAKVIKGGKELAKGKLARVLRGVLFTGAGFVKNPANPPSIVLETATSEVNNDRESKSEEIYLIMNNNVTSHNTEGSSKETDLTKESSANDDVGLCVSYKRRITDKEGKITNENWCALYDSECTSFSRDVTDPKCLLYSDLEKKVEAMIKNKKLKNTLSGLKAALGEAVKTRSL